MGNSNSSTKESTSIIYDKPKLAILNTALRAFPGEVVIDIAPNEKVTLSDTKQLHQIVAITIALANANDSIINTLNSISGKNPYLDQLLAIRMDEDGPQGINDKVTQILTNLVNSGDLSQFDTICTSLTALLPILAIVFGDWIGNLAYVSDNNPETMEGPVTDIIRELIQLGAHESFSLIKDFYYAAGDDSLTLQKTMTSAEQIELFLVATLNTIRKIINEYGGNDFYEGDITTMATTTVYGYLGQIILSKIIEEQFRPAIKSTSYLLSRILPLTFVTLAINEFCTQKDTLSTLGTPNATDTSIAPDTLGTLGPISGQ